MHIRYQYEANGDWTINFIRVVGSSSLLEYNYMHSTHSCPDYLMFEFPVNKTRPAVALNNPHVLTFRPAALAQRGI